MRTKKLIISWLLVLVSIYLRSNIIKFNQTSHRDSIHTVHILSRPDAVVIWQFAFISK